MLRKIKIKFEKVFRRFFHLIYRKTFVNSFIDEFVRLSALDEAIGIAVNNQISGDYFEFGVYRGDSFARAFKKFQQLSLSMGTTKLYDKMSFVAFDSFEGLPESSDSNVPDQYFKGAYSASERSFLSNLKSKSVDLSKVKIVKGFYDKSLTKETIRTHQLKNLSVAYFDVDLYESTKLALDFVTPMVQNGTILVFDDWYRHKCLPEHGVQRACNEWLSQNSHIKLHVVHRYRRIAFSVQLKEES
jgi:O-methyltransferase